MTTRAHDGPGNGAAPNGAAPPAYLDVRGLGKRFGAFIAIDDISLGVAAGEFVTFLGPSGCGKTTLLRAIAGLDPPSAGRIFQAGREITQLPPAARDFGIVFQSYALFPNLTVAQNIGYGLRGPSWPRARAQARITELLALIGLPEQTTKYPAQLSGGQQQRVALARALANEPGLLLLDEPLSALDAIVRQSLRHEIRSLQRRLGVTTIMVTHDQEEAMSVSDRIVVMNRGRIEQIGTPAEIYDAPATPFVAGFIGHSSRFAASVEAPGGLLQAGGMALRAEAARRLDKGTRVDVFLRPEHVMLHRMADRPCDAVGVEVASIEYLGPSCRLVLHAGDLQIAAATSPAAARALGAGPGAALAALLPAERLMVFPAHG